MRKSLLCLSAVIFSACSAGEATRYLQMKNMTPPSLDNFDHCYAYGCQKRLSLSLPLPTQQKLKQAFQNNENETLERGNIAKAIAIFEKDIGKIAGTDTDKKGTFLIYEEESDHYNKSFQQDCVDESTNTTTYLVLLEQMELLKFHKPVFPVNRYPIASGNRWWHQTAAIQEIATGSLYVVDSWFHDNGARPEILMVSEWKAGWKPNRGFENTSLE